MKKKQLFAGALAAAMMTASLAGCGGAASSAATSTTGGDTAGSTASADTNSGVVEVTIPSFKTGENVGAVFFEPQVERFNEKYAGKYKINLESVPQDSIFNDRIKQLAQRNKAETQPFSAVEKAIFWSPSAETNSSMLIALMSASVLHIAEL